jgi:hypothetical protein
LLLFDTPLKRFLELGILKLILEFPTHLERISLHYLCKKNANLDGDCKVVWQTREVAKAIPSSIVQLVVRV